MKRIERFDTEIKLGVVRREEDERLVVVEVDKDGNELDAFTLEELFEGYEDKEYIQLAIKYSREV